MLVLQGAKESSTPGRENQPPPQLQTRCRQNLNGVEKKLGLQKGNGWSDSIVGRKKPRLMPLKIESRRSNESPHMSRCQDPKRWRTTLSLYSTGIRATNPQALKIQRSRGGCRLSIIQMGWTWMNSFSKTIARCKAAGKRTCNGRRRN